MSSHYYEAWKHTKSVGQLKPYASGWTQACVLYLTTPIIVQTTEMPYLLKVTLNSLAGNPVYTLVALMMESKLGIGIFTLK